MLSKKVTLCLSNNTTYNHKWTPHFCIMLRHKHFLNWTFSFLFLSVVLMRPLSTLGCTWIPRQSDASIGYTQTEPCVQVMPSCSVIAHILVFWNLRMDVQTQGFYQGVLSLWTVQVCIRVYSKQNITLIGYNGKCKWRIKVH